MALPMLYLNLLFAGALFLAYWSLSRRKGSRLPPGPRGVPLLGNVLQLPPDDQHKTFAKWRTHYGDNIFIRFFGKPALVLNSLEGANELMEKRGAKYSNRPRFVFLQELVGADPVLPLLPYNEQWRRHRKWFQWVLQDKDMLQSYRPIQMREAHRLLEQLIKRPDDFVMHLKRFVGALSMEISYGHTARSLQDDEFIELADRAVTDAVDGGGPAATLVDFFPFLRRVPIFRNKALQMRRLMRDTIEIPYNAVKEELAQGTAKQCFATALLEEESNGKTLTAEDEYNIMGAAGAFYIAAAGTTGTVLTTFVLAMVLHPEVRRKAQAEIDRVIGATRLPELEDRKSLPYVECVLSEVYRWNPPAPLGLPHELTEDDEYQGYSISAGTMIIPNIWSVSTVAYQRVRVFDVCRCMTRDESVYPDPEAFRPERFEKMDASEYDSRDPRRIVFGFGRRLCPARQFADSNVWLAIASMLAAFDFDRAHDANGWEITPQASFASGGISYPKPFRCEIQPRSQKVVNLVAQMNVGGMDL
ncbi:cytochrome P450 [Laetiporus sulphureus 93-53]|uniref:Cytochrome P450 n=1 Tax=Laetiporus sulphureus 93-53 TaxID=1314785 RepID=A0A165DJY9_9APHY|nr:cytochrome P450 [Laetiporus sulphureus 93-53]KZT05049.1 cytochrome P450 [Laetiporus sulphureus 93-53]